jgi:hypothetical protein
MKTSENVWMSTDRYSSDLRKPDSNQACGKLLTLLDKKDLEYYFWTYKYSGSM